MGHVNGRDADAALKLLKLVPCRGAKLCVEIGERLVEEKNLGLPHQRSREGNPLALAARKRAWLALQ
jgi:hypothetical protein